MADITHDGLETALRVLARRLDYPPAPDLRVAVRQRIQQGPVPFEARAVAARGLVRFAAIAALLLLALAAAAMALSPSARTAVAGWLGVPGIAITHISEVPAPVPTITVPEDADLGRRIDLAEARGRVAFPVRVLAGPGLRDVYLDTRVAGGMVHLVYAHPESSAVLLSQFQGTVPDQPIGGKGLPPGTRLEVTEVMGRPAIWIEGPPHIFFLYRDLDGRMRQEQSRLAGHVLLWELGGVTLRLEGDLTREEAVRLAGGLVP